MEMMALSGTVLIISTQYLPEVWPVSVLLGGSAILLTQRPELLWPVLPIVYPTMGLSLILAWNRAARQAPRSGPWPHRASASPRGATDRPEQ